MQQPEIFSAQDKLANAGSRALLGAALAVLILYAVGLIALGTPPTASDTGEQVVTWFREHGKGARWFVWATTVSIPPFAVMFTLLRGLLPAPHRDVFWIGAVTLVVTYAVQAWTWGGLALHADRLEPRAARAILDVAVFWGPVLTGATTTMIAPVTLLALRGQAGLPRWLGVLGAAAFAGTGYRNHHDLRVGGLYRAGWPNESAARRGTNSSVDARLRGMGRLPWRPPPRRAS